MGFLLGIVVLFFWVLARIEKKLRVRNKWAMRRGTVVSKSIVMYVLRHQVCQLLYFEYCGYGLKVRRPTSSSFFGC